MFKVLKGSIALAAVLVSAAAVPIASAEEPCAPDTNGCESIVVVGNKSKGSSGGHTTEQTAAFMAELTDSTAEPDPGGDSPAVPNTKTGGSNCSAERAEVERIEREIEAVESSGGYDSASHSIFSRNSIGLIQGQIQQYGSNYKSLGDDETLAQALKRALRAKLNREKELAKLRQELAQAQKALADCMQHELESSEKK